jgi:glycosyltransferase involved in cell wall biosynthesis
VYRKLAVGVVIPAYNEEGFIGEVIREMPGFVDTIYVVDDFSTDGTWDETLATARTHEASLSESTGRIVADGGMLSKRAIVHEPIGRVIPIKHTENRGAGGAIKTGYLAALADRVDVIVTADGDGQMDLSQMSRLLDPIVEGKADYAKGNRLLYRDFREEMPAFRFVGNSILTFLTKIASGYWKMMDPQNGYTAISYRALENVGVETMYEYYGYCNDLLVKLNAKGMRVADVAIPAVYGKEASSIRYTEYISKVSVMLLRNFLWRLKTRYLILDFHPLALFYTFGAGMTTFGVAGVFWTVYVHLAFGASLFVRGSLSLMIFTMGSMFLMFAMLFDMQANEDREVQIHE